MSWLSQLGERARSALATASDADLALIASMSGFIELAATRYAVSDGARWEPGIPLKMLLAGYSGTRNTGADVRVEEMIRQFRHLFGDDHLDLSILTIDPEGSRGYFKTVKQLHFPKIFPKWLYETVDTQHAVIACEGSMFKSKFANALSTMMGGALGLAAAQNKIAVGYGGEAGAMDPALERFVARYCRDSLVICRNENSQRVLGRLGVATQVGTDTAWTFDPGPPARARRLLEQSGWDGETPVLAICPINAFWWPVKADVGKATARLLTGAHARSHYASVYFHAASPEITAKQRAYEGAIARAVDRFRRKHDVFPILFGSEQLDRRACEGVNAALGDTLPLFVSDEYDMYDMVGVLRQASMVVSSRYHAIVTCMPAGVPSAGITMDERIRNLMADRGTPRLALEVSDPALDTHLEEVLEELYLQGPQITQGIERCVSRNLEMMGRMGQILVDHVRAAHPAFPFAPELGLAGDPWDHLPPLNPQLTALLERVRAEAAA